MYGYEQDGEQGLSYRRDEKVKLRVSERLRSFFIMREKSNNYRNSLNFEYSKSENKIFSKVEEKKEFMIEKNLIK